MCKYNCLHFIEQVDSAFHLQWNSKMSIGFLAE